MNCLLKLRSICALAGVALVGGCQPIQTQSIAVPQVLFAAPPPMPVGPAVVAPPVLDTTVIPPKINTVPGTACVNPLFLPVVGRNQDLVWEQIVDVVDNYFRIERENRVQLIGNVVTEGRIDTFPQVGATWLEPHRPDSDGFENRWESTLQTIRRRAVMRVIPAQGGYFVDLAVYKELEDLPRPEHATSGAATFRYDNSLPSRLGDKVLRTRFSKSWLPQGRDVVIEQQMLAEIQASVTGVASLR
ncbi:MAG: hypothetical protein GXP26_10475 [Planctomycetes bacterium]|nr:hypothetical protein [Planctomycetota bacterium]